MGACPDGGDKQRAVAQAMGVHASVAPVDFLINTGDSFYPFGLASHDDPQWNSTFESVYIDRSLQVPWYGVLGNHDWRRNVSALVTSRGRWRIPAMSYIVRGV